MPLALLEIARLQNTASYLTHAPAASKHGCIGKNNIVRRL
jgi:hypothetical protein